MRREYFGQPGHLCVSRACRFHIHTHVNGYCISTVGEYYPGGRDQEKPTEVGSGRLYETMVFRLLPDGSDVESFCDLDAGAYNDRDEANRGHEHMVCKWAEVHPTEQGRVKT